MTVSPYCPSCQRPGRPVPRLTVRSLLVDEARQRFVDTDYGLCLTPTCAISYFAFDGVVRFDQEDLRVPLGFKRDAHPRYVCYCNKITADDIEAILREHGPLTMPQIIRLLRGEVQSDCRHNNPFGECCAEHFHEVLAAIAADRKE